MKNMISRRPWLLLFVTLFILSACSVTGSEVPAGPASAVSEAAPVDTTNEAEVDEVDEVDAETAVDAEPEADETLAPARPQKEIEILTEDDRSGRLRSLTDSWNTNWNLHTVLYSEILSGGPPRDGIPSIDAPQFESIAEAAEWLVDQEPVVALEINGDARAYPLSIITWHEIVNDEVGGEPVVVTFCPLCNSAVVFDRRVGDQTFEFGVSGLLRNSDLIMYDRTTETLWQQFTGEGIIGDLTGEQLTFLPSSLVSLADFREAHPEGVVLSQETGFNRSYGRNPYAGYDTYDNPLSAGGNLVLFQGTADTRLEAAARVVTVSLTEQQIDIAYPLSILAEVGVINDTQGEQDLVVFHVPGTNSALGAASIAEAEDVGATAVFDPNLNGEKLTFRRDGDQIIDEQTNSAWNIFGQATDGELAGQSLTPVVHGDHFWFSWAAFRPDTVIYGGS